MNEAQRAEARRQARERFDKQFGGSEASSSFDPGEPSSHDTFGLEDRCRDAWARSPELRAEFGGEFERFLAFKKAEAKGKAKIIGRSRGA